MTTLSGFSRADIQKLLNNVDQLSDVEIQSLYEALENLNNQEHVEKCQGDLIEFAKHMQEEFTVGTHHRILANELMSVEAGAKDRVCVNMPPRHGKLCAHDTLVPTPSGYRLHGDLRPGDFVFGLDGRPTEVVALGEDLECDVEVEFSNGEVIKCHENHEWSVYSLSAWPQKLKNCETKELEREVWLYARGTRGSRAKWQLPDAEALEYPNTELPLHPYVLGAWLGDGSRGKPCITGVDEDIFTAVTSFLGVPESARHVHKDTGVTTVSWATTASGVPVGRGKLSAFSADLASLGVRDNKHIPEQYLRASRQDRLLLLAGLIDTDGSYNPKTGRYRFSNTNEMLVKGTLDLVNGLGFRGRVTYDPPRMSSSGVQGKQTVFHVAFHPTEALPVVLDRKKTRKFASRRRISIREIRRVSPSMGRCIQVAAEDGLYLVGKTNIPTHNSNITSLLYPAWFIGKNPTKSIILVSHTTDLAVDFGRKVRNLIASDKYAEIFPDVSLAADSKSSGRWNTNHGGEFFACGVGSALAGRGADLLLIDDPVSEQDLLAGNFSALETTYNWFAYGARTRLMRGGRIAITQTRWHKEDLTGRVINNMTKDPDSDQYEVVEFPAILEVPDENGNIVEKALWPEFFPLKELKRTKASMPLFQWNAQYQQNPTSEEAAVIKREWWRTWKRPKFPPCEAILMSLDAAAEKHNRADFTALTTWGVFTNEETGAYNLILLNSIKRRVDFPELKRLCLNEYKEWQPDSFIVEKKSAGVAIYQELHRMGIPVTQYTPHRGSGDKMARLNSVADIIASGMVWVPETSWAEELVEEVAAFPFAAHDDLVDSTVYALMRFRQGGLIRLNTDYDDEPVMRPRATAYY